MRSMFYLVLFLTCVCSFEVFSLGCFFCLSVSGCLGHFRPCCHSSPLARRHFSLTRVACRAPMYRLKLPMILYSRDHLSFACTGQCEVHLRALMIFFFGVAYVSLPSSVKMPVCRFAFLEWFWSLLPPHPSVLTAPALGQGGAAFDSLLQSLSHSSVRSSCFRLKGCGPAIVGS